MFMNLKQFRSRIHVWLLLSCCIVYALVTLGASSAEGATSVQHRKAMKKRGCHPRNHDPNPNPYGIVNPAPNTDTEYTAPSNGHTNDQLGGTDTASNDPPAQTEGPTDGEEHRGQGMTFRIQSLLQSNECRYSCRHIL